MQNNAAKEKPSDKDTISQLKKDIGKKKEVKLADNEEDWNQPDSEEEAEAVKNTAVVAEQIQTQTDKPKKLKDLFNDTQPKPKQTKPKQQGEKRKKPNEGGDIAKPTFVNTKGTANAQIIDKKREQNEVLTKKYTGAQNLINQTAEENAKIKPTKNYLESDLTKKTYTKENLKEFAKPEFRNLKVSENEGEHFVEYNKNEDLFLKNLTEKKVDLKPVYSMPQEEGSKGEKKDRIGKKDYGDRHPKKDYNKRKEGGEYQKQNDDYKKEEEEEDVDSDGFQVVKKNEWKTPTGRSLQRVYRQYHKDGYRKKEGGEKNFRRGKEPKQNEEEKGGNQSNSEIGEGERGNIEEEKQEAKEEVEALAKIEKKDGATITFKSGGAQKLKDLFS